MKKIDKLDVISIIVIIAALITVIYAFICLYQYRQYEPTQQIIVTTDTRKSSGHYTGYVKGADGQQHWYDGEMDIGFDSSVFETDEIKKANKEAQNIEPIKPIEHPDF